MNWKQSKHIWVNDNLLSAGPTSVRLISSFTGCGVLIFCLFQNLNVSVITCQVSNENGKNKQYLEIKDGICYGVDTQVNAPVFVIFLDS
jgi:hypothetical protein